MTTRRDFVKASLVSLAALQTDCGFARRTTPRWTWPHIGGALSHDDAVLRAAADDWGHYVERLPRAVLQPASLKDVASIVRHAYQTGLRVAIRGRGHAAYGQAQAADGVVIDSRTLSEMRWTGTDQITVDAGALWDDVATETLKRGLIPPVMTDMQLLSVGGTLSAGGTGEMSLRLGAQVDHVTALEVVTGTGTIESCSVSTNEELFQMTLAGMGQCALIGRASLQLTRAPQEISLRRLLYDRANDLLFDLQRLATTDTFETMGAEITRSGTGWSMELLLGSFLPAARASASILPRDLRFACEKDATRTSFLAWLRRRTYSVVSALQSPLPNVPLILTLPAAAAGPFLADLLSGSDASIGIWRIEVLPMVTARFTQPLHRLPDDPFAFSIRIQRRASARNAFDHLEMLRQNDDLVRMYVPSGAKIYPPFAPSLSQREWQLHFGPVWERFTRAKDHYDPKRVLTPGAGIFI